MLWKWAVRRKIAYQDLNIRQQFFFFFLKIQKVILVEMMECKYNNTDEWVIMIMGICGN